MTLINIHWFPRNKLRNLLYQGNLYRGSNGTVKIKNALELTGQVTRKSVWVNPEHVGIENIGIKNENLLIYNEEQAKELGDQGFDMVEITKLDDDESKFVIGFDNKPTQPTPYATTGNHSNKS